jgi:hypothetical protein
VTFRVFWVLLLIYDRVSFPPFLNQVLTLPEGRRLLNFDAVREIGFVSDGSDATSVFVPGATAAVAKSPKPSVCPLTRQIAAPYACVYPSAVPVLIIPSGSAVSYIYWLRPAQMRTLLGSTTTFCVGSQVSSVNVLSGGTVSLNDVMLVLRNISLTPYTTGCSTRTVTSPE